jgi:hypothetical protein
MEISAATEILMGYGVFGIFGILFISLFVYVLKQGEKRDTANKEFMKETQKYNQEMAVLLKSACDKINSIDTKADVHHSYVTAKLSTIEAMSK